MNPCSLRIACSSAAHRAPLLAVVRPGGLKSEPPTGIVTAGSDQDAGAITRADVAAFCLDAVIEPEFQFLKQAVSISSNMGSGFQSVLADKTKSRMAAQ